MGCSVKELFFLLATGWGFGTRPEGPEKIKTACREAGCAILAVSATVALSSALDFYMLKPWLPAFFRPLIFVMLAYLILKAAEFSRLGPCPETLVPFAVAVTLWVSKEGVPVLEASGYAVVAAAGAGLVFILTASVAERLDFSPAFKDFRVVPVFFGLLGIFSLIFRAFRAIY